MLISPDNKLLALDGEACGRKNPISLKWTALSSHNKSLCTNESGRGTTGYRLKPRIYLSFSMAASFCFCLPSCLSALRVELNAYVSKKSFSGVVSDLQGKKGVLLCLVVGVYVKR